MHQPLCAWQVPFHIGRSSYPLVFRVVQFTAEWQVSGSLPSIPSSRLKVRHGQLPAISSIQSVAEVPLGGVG